jgi:hypothetical protein
MPHRRTTNPASMLRPASNGSAASFASASRAELHGSSPPGHAGVERQQQVERLRVSHLADDQAVRPHAQRLLDEPPQGDLAGALETRLPALQRDRSGASTASSNVSSTVTIR